PALRAHRGKRDRPPRGRWAVARVGPGPGMEGDGAQAPADALGARPRGLTGPLRRASGVRPGPQPGRRGPRPTSANLPSGPGRRSPEAARPSPPRDARDRATGRGRPPSYEVG